MEIMQGWFTRDLENAIQAEEARQYKWDFRFLEMAKLVASWSKDESTQAGAVIVDENRCVVSVGYNGFARGTSDDVKKYRDRDLKMAMVVHAEENAIVMSERWRLKGATLYTFPFQPCAKCAGLVIQAGIKRCVAVPLSPDRVERWAKNIELAKQQFIEAGVELVILGE